MRVAIQVRIFPALTILSLFSRELNNSVICYESLTIGWSMVFFSSIENHVLPVVMRVEHSWSLISVSYIGKMLRPLL